MTAPDVPAPARARLDDLPDLVARTRVLASKKDGRVLLGLVGEPGAGKSTLGRQLVEAIGASAILVPMDGFHLAQEVLDRLGRAERKGAPDTFDAAGFVALLERLREPGPSTVYAPTFRRDLEEPIAGAIPVTPAHLLVVTEGNYLLDDSPDWAPVRAMLDEVWYLEPPEESRVARLVRRHMEHGRDLTTARRRALGSDQRNAERVRLGKSRADLVLH